MSFRASENRTNDSLNPAIGHQSQNTEDQEGSSLSHPDNATLSEEDQDELEATNKELHLAVRESKTNSGNYCSREGEECTIQ